MGLSRRLSGRVCGACRASHNTAQLGFISCTQGLTLRHGNSLQPAQHAKCRSPGNALAWALFDRSRGKTGGP